MEKTFEHNNKIIKIVTDESPYCPRTSNNFDNFGKMVCFHNRYSLGDEDQEFNQDDYESWDELEKAIQRKGNVTLPIYMLDHSGLTIDTEPFNCPWDSGQVGFIYVSKDSIRNEFNISRVTKKYLKKALHNLKCEVNTYNDFLTGNVYGFVIYDKDKNIIDSCYGFYGDPDESGCISEAKEYTLNN